MFVVLPAQILVNLVEASGTLKQLSSAIFPSFTPKPIILTRHERLLIAKRGRN